MNIQEKRQALHDDLNEVLAKGKASGFSPELKRRRIDLIRTIAKLDVEMAGGDESDQALTDAERVDLDLKRAQLDALQSAARNERKFSMSSTELFADAFATPVPGATPRAAVSPLMPANIDKESMRASDLFEMALANPPTGGQAEDPEGLL